MEIFIFIAALYYAILKFIEKITGYPLPGPVPTIKNTWDGTYTPQMEIHLKEIENAYLKAFAVASEKLPEYIKFGKEVAKQGVKTEDFSYDKIGNTSFENREIQDHVRKLINDICDEHAAYKKNINVWITDPVNVMLKVCIDMLSGLIGKSYRDMKEQVDKLKKFIDELSSKDIVKNNNMSNFSKRFSDNLEELSEFIAIQINEDSVRNKMSNLTTETINLLAETTFFAMYILRSEELAKSESDKKSLKEALITSAIKNLYQVIKVVKSDPYGRLIADILETQDFEILFKRTSGAKANTQRAITDAINRNENGDYTVDEEKELIERLKANDSGIVDSFKQEDDIKLVINLCRYIKYNAYLGGLFYNIHNYAVLGGEVKVTFLLARMDDKDLDEPLLSRMLDQYIESVKIIFSLVQKLDKKVNEFIIKKDIEWQSKDLGSKAYAFFKSAMVSNENGIEPWSKNYQSYLKDKKEKIEGFVKKCIEVADEIKKNQRIKDYKPLVSQERKTSQEIVDSLGNHNTLWPNFALNSSNKNHLEQNSTNRNTRTIDNLESKQMIFSKRSSKPSKPSLVKKTNLNYLLSLAQVLIKDDAPTKKADKGKNGPIISIIFSDHKLVSQFQQELKNIGIENRGMPGQPRTVNVIPPLPNSNANETYSIDLTEAEYKSIMGDSSFAKLVSSHQPDKSASNDETHNHKVKNRFKMD